MTIAHQSAMTEERTSARPLGVTSPHQPVRVGREPPATTLAKIVCLIAVAAFGTALPESAVAG